MGTLICTSPPATPYVAPANFILAYPYRTGAARITWGLENGVSASAGTYLGVRVTATPGDAVAFFPPSTFLENIFYGLTPGKKYRFTMVVVTSLSESRGSVPSNELLIAGDPAAPVPTRTPTPAPAPGTPSPRPNTPGPIRPPQGLPVPPQQEYHLPPPLYTPRADASSTIPGKITSSVDGLGQVSFFEGGSPIGPGVNINRVRIHLNGTIWL